MIIGVVSILLLIYPIVYTCHELGLIHNGDQSKVVVMYSLPIKDMIFSQSTSRFLIPKSQSESLRLHGNSEESLATTHPTKDILRS